MAETASADGKSSTENLIDDDGQTKENLKEESLQDPVSGKLAKTILSYLDDLVVGPPDTFLNGEEVEDDRITNKGRREAASTTPTATPT